MKRNRTRNPQARDGATLRAGSMNSDDLDEASLNSPARGTGTFASTTSRTSRSCSPGLPPRPSRRTEQNEAQEPPVLRSQAHHRSKGFATKVPFYGPNELGARRFREEEASLKPPARGTSSYFAYPTIASIPPHLSRNTEHPPVRNKACRRLQEADDTSTTTQFAREIPFEGRNELEARRLRGEEASLKPPARGSSSYFACPTIASIPQHQRRDTEHPPVVNQACRRLQEADDTSTTQFASEFPFDGGNEMEARRLREEGQDQEAAKRSVDMNEEGLSDANQGVQPSEVSAMIPALLPDPLALLQQTPLATEDETEEEDINGNRVVESAQGQETSIEPPSSGQRQRGAVGTPGAFAVQGQTTERRIRGFISPAPEEQMPSHLEEGGHEPNQALVDAMPQLPIAAEVASQGDFEARVQDVLQRLIAQSSVPAETVMPVETRDVLEESVEEGNEGGNEDESVNVNIGRKLWKRLVFIAVAVFLLVAIVVGVTAGLLSRSDGESSSPTPNPNSSMPPSTTSPTAEQTNEPTEQPPTPPPTIASTRNPTVAPTASPTDSPTTLPPTNSPPGPTLPLPDGVWQQLGQDIDGKSAGDRTGWSVSLSRDANVMAVGAPGDAFRTSIRGYVQLYQFNSATMSWSQLGNDIDGQTIDDQFGWSISLNGEGNIVAVGGNFNDANGSDAGHVRVYQYNSATQEWMQMGQDLNGEAAGDSFGWSVSLSNDGHILAVGGRYNDGSGKDAGHVRVFQYNSATLSWSQLGQDIDGEDSGDEFGFSVSLNGAGNIVAVGADEADSANGVDSGHVRVFQYNSAIQEWMQMGQDINGEAADDDFGWSVSLSNDGHILAVGDRLNDNSNGDNAGHVRVYQYNSTTLNWSQLGQDIDGEAAGDEYGRSVSMNSAGNVLAVGGYLNDANGFNSGHVRVYQYDMTRLTWARVSQDIDGETAGDLSGFSVSLSGNGTAVAVGAPENSDQGTDAGHARVYTLN